MYFKNNVADLHERHIDVFSQDANEIYIVIWQSFKFLTSASKT